MRLNDQGLLEEEWRPSDKHGRPPRHAYRLTNSGVELAASQALESPNIRDIAKVIPT